MLVTPPLPSPSFPRAAQEPPAESPPASAATPLGETGVDVTFLANAGFLIESRDQAVLIDAVTRDNSGNFSALPANAQGQIVNARPPFDRALSVLVSHSHPDHLDARALARFLVNNRGASLASSLQVVRAVRKDAPNFAPIQERVHGVLTEPGKVVPLPLEGVRVECFELSHGSKTGDGLVNLAHLIEIGGLRILHVGDAEPAEASFEPFRLEQREIDLAILPYWFFATDEAVGVARALNARETVVCHLPKADRDMIVRNLRRRYGHVILFAEPMEKHRFVSPRSPAAPGAAGG